jgi:hypothetical protein
METQPKKKGRPFGAKSKPKEMPEVSTAPKSELIKPKPKEMPKDPPKAPPKEPPKKSASDMLNGSIADKIKALERFSLVNKKELMNLEKKLDQVLKKIR